MNDLKAANVTGPSWPSLLGILFVGLKLTGHINWPWIWVLAPFWVPVSILLIFLFFAGVLCAIVKPQDKN